MVRLSHPNKTENYQGSMNCWRHGLRVPALLISPDAKRGWIDHQTLSFDAYLKFIEDIFLDGQRIDPLTDGRPDSRPNVRENNPLLGDLLNDLDFSQEPLPPLILPLDPAPGPASIQSRRFSQLSSLDPSRE